MLILCRETLTITGTSSEDFILRPLPHKALRRVRHPYGQSLESGLTYGLSQSYPPPYFLRRKLAMARISSSFCSQPWWLENRLDSAQEKRKR